MKQRCFVDVLLKVVAMLYRLFSLFVVIHFLQLWPAAFAETHAEVMQSLSDANVDQSHSHPVSTGSSYRRTINSYAIPDVILTDFNGRETSLRSELISDRPVFLNFIFTTCTTICPVMTATFSQLQDKLQSESVKPRMVSISIEPEHDTPARLRDYAKRFGAGSQWQFITGDLKSIISVQRIFDAYRGDKMNHVSLTLIYVPEEDQWLRLEGFFGAADLIREYHQVIGQ